VNRLFKTFRPAGFFCTTGCTTGCKSVNGLWERQCANFFYRAMLCVRGTSHGPVSVRHKSVFYRNGWTNRAAGFLHVSFLPPILHCAKRKFGCWGQRRQLPPAVAPGSCPRVQQARGAQNCLTKNILLLTTTEVSMINSDEWAKGSLSLQTLAIFCLVCLSITYSAALHFTFEPHAPPSPQKNIGRGRTSLVLFRHC